MRIATYNVWNENKGMGHRFAQIIDEINAVDADIIGLQEITTRFYKMHLLKQTMYQHYDFKRYGDEDEGLAILSKYPIAQSYFLNESEDYHFSAGLNVIFNADGFRFSLTNLHLPWDSAILKERQIVAIDRYIHLQKGNADFFILLGDFNGSFNSSVHRYLLGEQTINGKESKPYWYELSSAYAALNGLLAKPTLDFINNPRWGGKNTTDIPYNADRIYIMLHYGKKFSENLKHVDIFGTKVSPENNLSASDHYGVVADVEFTV